jgi:hypothetical protein
MTCSAVHASMKNFSPAKHIDITKQKRQAVDRLARKERKALISKRVDGVDLDGSFKFGSMLTLAMDMRLMSLSRLIQKHNDPADP